MDSSKKVPLFSELSSAALITGDEWFVLSFLISESKDILVMEESDPHRPAVIGTLFTLLLLRHGINLSAYTSNAEKKTPVSTQHQLTGPRVQTQWSVNLEQCMRDIGRCMQSCSRYRYTYCRDSSMVNIAKHWGVTYKYKSAIQYHYDLYQFLYRCIVGPSSFAVVRQFVIMYNKTTSRDVLELSVFGRKKYTLIEHNCVRVCTETTTEISSFAVVGITKSTSVNIAKKRKQRTLPSCLEHLLELCVRSTDLDAVPNPVVDVAHRPCCVEP